MEPSGLCVNPMIGVIRLVDADQLPVGNLGCVNCHCRQLMVMQRWSLEL